MKVNCVKKPMPVQAVQWENDNFEEIDKFCGELKDGQRVAYMDGHTLHIRTLEGDHTAAYRDYIIKGVRGECYPCKCDIFEETYDYNEAFESEELEQHIKNNDWLCINQEEDGSYYFQPSKIEGGVIKGNGWFVDGQEPNVKFVTEITVEDYITADDYGFIDVIDPADVFPFMTREFGQVTECSEIIEGFEADE